MSRKEVQDAQHRFVPAKPVEAPKSKTTFLDGSKANKEPVAKKPVEFYYTMGATHTEDENGAMAKKVVYSNGKTEFFVKFATAGAGVGRMLNPWGVYYNVGDEHKYEKTMGRKRYEFRKVSEVVFNNYLKFLETRNERHILNAERESVNG